MGQSPADNFQAELRAAVELMRSRRPADAEASLRALVAAMLPSAKNDPLRAGGRVIAALSALFALQLTQGKQTEADRTALLVQEAAWAADDFANTGNMTWWRTVTPVLARYGRPEGRGANLDPAQAEQCVA